MPLSTQEPASGPRISFLLSCIRHFWQDPEPCSWQPPPFFSRSLLLQQYVHFIVWNRDKAKDLQAAEWQEPPVTRIKSWTHDEEPAVVKGTLRCSIPTHTPLPCCLTLLLLQAYCKKPVHLLCVETHQGALISAGISVLRTPNKFTGTCLSKKIKLNKQKAQCAPGWWSSSRSIEIKFASHILLGWIVFYGSNNCLK